MWRLCVKIMLLLVVIFTVSSFGCKPKGTEPSSLPYELPPLSIPNKLEKPAIVNKDQMKDTLSSAQVSTDEKNKILFQEISGMSREQIDNLDKNIKILSNLLKGDLAEGVFITGRAAPRLYIKSDLKHSSYTGKQIVFNIIKKFFSEKYKFSWKMPFSETISEQGPPFSSPLRAMQNDCPSKIYSSDKLEFDYSRCEHKRGKIIITGAEEVIKRIKQIDDGIFPDDLVNFKGSANIKSENLQSIVDNTIYGETLNFNLQIDISKWIFKTSDPERKRLEGVGSFELSGSAELSGEYKTSADEQPVSEINISSLKAKGALTYSQQDNDNFSLSVMDTGISTNLSGKSSDSKSQTKYDFSLSGEVVASGKMDLSKREIKTSEGAEHSLSLKDAKLNINSVKGAISRTYQGKTTGIEIEISGSMKGGVNYSGTGKEGVKEFTSTDSYTQDSSIGSLNIKLSVKEAKTTKYSLNLAFSQTANGSYEYKNSENGSDFLSKLNIEIKNITLKFGIDTSEMTFLSPSIKLINNSKESYYSSATGWTSSKDETNTISVQKSYIKGFDGEEFFVYTSPDIVYSEKSRSGQGTETASKDISGSLIFEGSGKLELQTKYEKVSDEKERIFFNVLFNGEKLGEVDVITIEELETPSENYSMGSEAGLTVIKPSSTIQNYVSTGEYYYARKQICEKNCLTLIESNQNSIPLNQIVAFVDYLIFINTVNNAVNKMNTIGGIFSPPLKSQSFQSKIFPKQSTGEDMADIMLSLLLIDRETIEQILKEISKSVENLRNNPDSKYYALSIDDFILQIGSELPDDKKLLSLKFSKVLLRYDTFLRIGAVATNALASLKMIASHNTVLDMSTIISNASQMLEEIRNDPVGFYRHAAKFFDLKNHPDFLKFKDGGQDAWKQIPQDISKSFLWLSESIDFISSNPCQTTKIMECYSSSEIKLSIDKNYNNIFLGRKFDGTITSIAPQVSSASFKEISSKFDCSQTNNSVEFSKLPTYFLFALVPTSILLSPINYHFNYNLPSLTNSFSVTDTPELGADYIRIDPCRFFGVKNSAPKPIRDMLPYEYSAQDGYSFAIEIEGPSQLSPPAINYIKVGDSSHFSDISGKEIQKDFISPITEAITTKTIYYPEDVLTNIITSEQIGLSHILYLQYKDPTFNNSLEVDICSLLDSAINISASTTIAQRIKEQAINLKSARYSSCSGSLWISPTNQNLSDFYTLSQVIFAYKRF